MDTLYAGNLGLHCRPKFRKIRLRTVGEEAFGVRQTNRQLDRQTDTLTDNKGRLELSGAREPINILCAIFLVSQLGY